jgi:hypothetical protein
VELQARTRFLRGVERQRRTSIVVAAAASALAVVLTLPMVSLLPVALTAAFLGAYLPATFMGYMALGSLEKRVAEKGILVEAAEVKYRKILRINSVATLMIFLGLALALGAFRQGP